MPATLQVKQACPRSVSLLGPLPPPIGGIAIHVQTLAEILTSEGVQCRVFDYGPKGVRGSVRALLRSANVILWAIYHSAVKGSTLHVHLSFGRLFAWIAAPLSILGLFRPLFITVHSGSFPRQVEGVSRFKRWLLGRAFRSARCVIAVSEEVKRALIEKLGVCPRAVRVIPPFLGAPPTPGGITRTAASVIASGYCTALYAWLDLVKALKADSRIVRADFVMYNTIDPGYLSKVREEIGTDSRFNLRFDIPRNAFLEMLARSDIFIRPTYADGDSLAIREALLAGCKVVASDCVSRPKGVILFRTADVRALSEAVRTCCLAKQWTTAEQGVGLEAYQAIRSLYAGVEASD